MENQTDKESISKRDIILMNRSDYFRKKAMRPYLYYVALDELIRTKEIKQGEKILLLVPESGRFSYGTVFLSI